MDNKSDDTPDQRDETKPLTDTPYTDIETKDTDVPTEDKSKPKLFVLEPGKKTASVSDNKVPTTKTKQTKPDQVQPKPTDNINNDIKSKPSEEHIKSETEPAHLIGDELKPTGETKSASDVSKLKEVPKGTSNETQDTHESDTEDDKSKDMLRPRIQDRKGSIRELIPDKKHGFQLMLKVVACPSPILHTHCYNNNSHKLLFFPQNTRSFILKSSNYKYSSAKMLIYSVL